MRPEVVVVVDSGADNNGDRCWNANSRVNIDFVEGINNEQQNTVEPKFAY